MSTTNPAPQPAPRPTHAPSGARRRWLPWTAAIVLVGLLIAGFRPRPVLVETARVSQGRIVSTVNEEGRTRIRQRFSVSAPVAGHLRRIPFKAGAPVVAGETVLAIIDPLPSSLLDARSISLAEARRDTAAAQLEKARASLGFTSIELQRFQKLFTDRAISPQELEGVQWRETAARKEVAAAESALRLAEAELAEFTSSSPGPSPGPSQGSNASPRPAVEVKSPVTGQILAVHDESARIIAPGAPLLEVGDPTDLEVVIEVLSRDGAAIRPGAKVELQQWGGDTSLEAVVRLVEPAAFTKISALGVEEQRVNVIADLSTPASQRPGLGDGFRVEARIVTWEAANTLKVPAGALFRRGSEWAAYVVRDGKAVSVPVSPGRASDSESQILSGLGNNDEIILYPGDRIRDGIRVQPIAIAP